MHPSRPIGNSLYGPLFLRLPLGAYFVLAGMLKLQAPLVFVEEVRKFNILPGSLADLFGIVLPYVELVAGGLILIGLFATMGAILTTIMLISFIFALGPTYSGPFNKDIILLGTSVALLYTGAGYFSIDNFRQSG